jgi:hypothetical protein
MIHCRLMCLSFCQCAVKKFAAFKISFRNQYFSKPEIQLLPEEVRPYISSYKPPDCHFDIADSYRPTPYIHNRLPLSIDFRTIVTHLAFRPLSLRLQDELEFCVFPSDKWPIRNTA